MYKTAWQTKEETSARLHSPKSTHVNPEHVVAVQQHMHKAEVAVQQQIYYETRAEELLYSLLNAMLHKVSITMNQLKRFFETR